MVSKASNDFLILDNLPDLADDAAFAQTRVEQLVDGEIGNRFNDFTAVVVLHDGIAAIQRGEWAHRVQGLADAGLLLFEGGKF